MDVPSEVWFLIMDYLSPWDNLQLRQTTHDMNTVVTGHQSFWYRHFTWYLIQQNKRIALFKTGCAKRHRPNVRRGVYCLTLAQEQQLSEARGVSVTDLPGELEHHLEWLDDDAYRCENVNHYSYVLPTNRFAIPLDSDDYHPNNGQLYLYRFLIHNYRRQRQRAKRYNKKTVERQITDVKKDLRRQRRHLKEIQSRCEKEIRKTKARDAFLRDMQDQLKRLDENRVFYGKRTREYKGLAGSV